MPFELFLTHKSTTLLITLHTETSIIKKQTLVSAGTESQSSQPPTQRSLFARHPTSNTLKRDKWKVWCSNTSY